MRTRLMNLQLSKRTSLILVPLLLLACGLSGTAAETPVPPETNPSATVEAAPAAATEPAEDAAPTEEPTTPPEATPEPNLLLRLPGVTEMENLMPTSGVGIRPLLEWQAVEGAVRYDVVVFEPDGTPYWAWRAGDTSVYVGGIDAPLPEEKEGPVIAAGMTWQVTAFNADEAPVGAGGPWPIAP